MNWTRINNGLMQSGQYWVVKSLMVCKPDEGKVITYICYMHTDNGMDYICGADTFKEAQAIVERHAQTGYDHAQS